MPPLTRKQSSVKAADVTKREPEDELSQDTVSVSVFNRLPPELQKTVVEYVRTSVYYSATGRLTDNRPAHPRVRLEKPLPRVERAMYFDASIPIPRRYLDSTPVERRTLVDHQLESLVFVSYPIATHHRSPLSSI